jgi:hypothetical protein
MMQITRNALALASLVSFVAISTVAQSTRSTITIPASEFLRPLNVALGGPNNMYGADVLLNAPPYQDRPNRAEYEFNAAGGTYLLKVEYAAEEVRPVNIYINGDVAIPNALAAPTGCWQPQCQLLLNQGRVTLSNGLNILMIKRAHYFPHIRKFVFVPVD